MEAQLTRIKQKIEYIQNEGWENYSDVFAFGRHRMVMNPPLSLEKLLEFEQTYQLRLPEGYRRFLLEIGNGGAGPYYGLLPLEKGAEDFTDEWLEEVIRFDSMGHLIHEYIAHPLPEMSYGSMPEDEGESDSAERTITLCDQGCNYFSLLVVKGKEPGRICYMGMMGELYYMPDADFLSWYERWLDGTLLRLDKNWPGGAGWMSEDNHMPNLEPLDFEEFLERRRVSAENSQKIADLGKPKRRKEAQLAFDW